MGRTGCRVSCGFTWPFPRTVTNRSSAVPALPLPRGENQTGSLEASPGRGLWSHGKGRPVLLAFEVSGWGRWVWGGAAISKASFMEP